VIEQVRSSQACDLGRDCLPRRRHKLDLDPMVQRRAEAQAPSMAAINA